MTIIATDSSEPRFFTNIEFSEMHGDSRDSIIDRIGAREIAALKYSFDSTGVSATLSPAAKAPGGVTGSVVRCLCGQGTGRDREYRMQAVAYQSAVAKTALGNIGINFTSVGMRMLLEFERRIVGVRQSGACQLQSEKYQGIPLEKLSLHFFSQLVKPG